MLPTIYGYNKDNPEFAGERLARDKPWKERRKGEVKGVSKVG